jgi:hypothetical protein
MKLFVKYIVYEMDRLLHDQDSEPKGRFRSKAYRTALSSGEQRGHHRPLGRDHATRPGMDNPQKYV